MKLIINFSVCLLFLSFNSFSQDSIRTIKEYTYGKYGEDWYTLNGDRKADLVDLKHLIVRLNSYSSMREFDYKKYNIPILEITRDNFVENFYELKIPLNEDPFEIAELLEESEEFENIFFNVFAELNSIPNDDLFNQQWNLLKVSSNDAWDIVHGKSDIIVGIIDVGADYNHDDLILNRWRENGGKDFIDMDDDPYPYDGARHGTAVAGVISATSNNIIGVASIGGGWGQNKGLTLMHLRAGIRDFFGREIISFSAAAAAIEWAAENGVRVINMSFGWQLTYPVMTTAINNAYNDYGVIFVASSGNYFDDGPEDSWIIFPANCITCQGLISVGATIENDYRKDLNDGTGEVWASCYDGDGRDLDLVAPGIHIPTTDITGEPGYETGNYYFSFNGTSAAAPLVSGLVGLILSVNSSLNYNDVYDVVTNTAIKVTGMEGQNYHDEYGYGIIDAYEALKYTLENYGGTLTQDLTIPIGETWNFNVPGVQVTLEKGVSIIVNGTLNVQGLSNNPIIFDRSGSNNWYGIVINSSSGSSSSITNAEIKNASYGLLINNASPSISSTKINYCGTGIQILSGAAPKFQNNTVTYNDYNGVNCIAGVTASFGPFPTWGDNVIRRNGDRGIYAAFSCTIFLGKSGLPPFGGRNSIYENYNTNGYQISIRYGSTSMAEKNWWGSDPPDPNIFDTSGPNDIDYDPWWLGSDPHAGRSLSKMSDNGYNPNTSPVMSGLDSLREKLWKAFIFYQKAEYDSVLIIGKEILITSHSSREALSALNLLRLAYNESRNPGFQGYITSLIAQHSGEELAGVARLNLAYYLAKQRDFAAALDQLQENVYLFPNSPLEKISLFQKAVLFLLELEDRNSTEAVLAELERKYPDDPLVVETRRLLGQSIEQYRPQEQTEPGDTIDFALIANYPNPFNPTTTIEYSIKQDGLVSLKVYDILGKEVAMLVNENKPVGSYSVDFDGSQLASGIYFYRLTSGQFSSVKKLILLK